MTTTNNATHAADPAAQAFLDADATLRISTGCGREVARAATTIAPTCGLCAAMLRLHAQGAK